MKIEATVISLLMEQKSISSKPMILDYLPLGNISKDFRSIGVDGILDIIK